MQYSASAQPLWQLTVVAAAVTGAVAAAVTGAVAAAVLEVAVLSLAPVVFVAVVMREAAGAVAVQDPCNATFAVIRRA